LVTFRVCVAPVVTFPLKVLVPVKIWLPDQVLARAKMLVPPTCRLAVFATLRVFGELTRTFPLKVPPPLKVLVPAKV
jgi:hypothetical protein